MKVLILTITAGEGHNSTANAIKDCLEARGIEPCVLDTYGYINKALRKIVAEGYLITSNKTKRAYSEVYQLAEKRSPSEHDFSPTRLLNRAFAMKLQGFIEGYRPDIIVYTHCFAGIIVEQLKTKLNMNFKSIGIVTDFTIHPFWEESLSTDYVVVANELLEYQILKKGFSKRQIIPTGIPINPKFSASVTKEAARTELGLDPGKFTVLLMGGSMGYGHMNETVKKLDEMDDDFQIITVCGRNASMYAKINELNMQKKLLNLGFVNNIELIMDAADCIVSKPGGLTTSEVLSKRLPMIIVDPIPGQEMRNTEFLLNCGAAMAASETCPVDEILYQLMRSPDRLASMRESMNIIRKPNSTSDLCDKIVEFVENGEVVL